MLTTVFGLVTRVVRFDAPEALASPKAKQAIDKELNNLYQRKSFDFNDVGTKEEIAAKHPNAEFVEGNMLLGIKYDERENDEDHFE